MTAKKGLTVRFLSLTIAFMVATYAVSSLMPLAVKVALTRPTGWDIGSLFLYLLLASLSIGFLGRAIYQLDKKTGRVRNRIGWFE